MMNFMLKVKRRSRFHLVPVRNLGPIHTIPDSSYIGLIPISDRPSIHTIPDESDMLRIAFAESNHSAVKVVCSGLLSISDHF